MKKYILRIVALLILASAVLPSCSVEYRQRHGHHDDHGNDHGGDRDHHYRGY
ncbi:hypothetical protein KXD93_28765 [Mucilaginibacter sp. BJC16-A38]|uniref:hypothetical protein n=1 Tax=Mucilaginibacter phenanthrenivorans TaxID=1234842 RepID=UPI0021576F0B|nr:hypothetical protein [Mucilaginibacter phenanthrenivorans]MCR8561682.1 hypothetical protein [Mucilaginibacter phenanthrenivorans]